MYWNDNYFNGHTGAYSALHLNLLFDVSSLFLQLGFFPPDILLLFIPLQVV